MQRRQMQGMRMRREANAQMQTTNVAFYRISSGAQQRGDTGQSSILITHCQTATGSVPLAVAGCQCLKFSQSLSV